MGNGEGGNGEVCAGLDAALLSRDYGGQRGLKSRGITREQLFETVLPFRSYSLPASVIKIYAQHLTESFIKTFSAPPLINSVPSTLEALSS